MTPVEVDPVKAALRLTAWPPQLAQVHPDWRELVEPFLDSRAGQSLGAHMQQALAAGAVVYPAQPFRALALTPLSQVRVVILGQDPYHGAGQAEGLAFSVAPGVNLPPSLRNIFKELQLSLELPIPTTGSLVHWAQQGVLLLNTSLTVEEGRAASHARWGWAQLTDQLVARVAAQPSAMVFMLWGGHAQAKRGLIESSAPDGRHLVLQANHPSPLSALRPPQPFLGCGHFVKTNQFLLAHGHQAINW